MKEINSKFKEYGLSVYKLAVFFAGIIFCIVTLVIVLTVDKYNTTRNLTCVLAGAALLMGPPIVGILMKFSINPVMYTYVMFYAVAAPLLGSVYNFYHLTSWWDDFLHFSGGVVFAVLGVYIAKFLNKNGKNTLIMCAMFAFLFSMSLSALWEVYEFTADSLFGMDMQRDTLISEIFSQDLDHSVGKVGIAEGIKETVITLDNGEQVVVKGGYLDIGLIDTMKDMIVESIGALAYCVIFLIDRDRHPIITSVNRKKIDK